MNRQCEVLIGLLGFVLPVAAFAQTSDPTPIVTTPTASQNISQPSGTSLSISGALGVGTTSPLGMLDVVDPASDTTPAVSIRTSVAPTYGSNGDNLLSIRGTGDSSNTWRGHVTTGGDNVVLLFGEYSGQAWFGAQTSTLSAWTDIHINPDGPANAYIGKNGIVSVQNSTGNVGVGTTAPSAKLEVSGSIKLTPGSGGSITFPDGTTQSTAFAGATFPSNLGVGTTQPNSWGVLPQIGGNNLQIFGQNTYARLIINATGTGQPELHFVNGSADPGQRNHRFYAVQSGLVLDQPNDDYSSTTPNMFWANRGNVGIGTTSPAALLDVNGSVKISGGGASLTFPDGTVQSTAYLGTSCTTAGGGDYAESVDVVGARSEYEPGDLIVIDPSNPAHFVKSTTAYSRLVAGIYSTKPGYVGRRQTSDARIAMSEVPMAMVGIVPAKVSAQNGSINVGDLLVTSDSVGYAMKGTDTTAMQGAIVGKALGSLKSGTGVVEVLVSLQ